jgi:hypothetical protein
MRHGHHKNIAIFIAQMVELQTEVRNILQELTGMRRRERGNGTP